MQRHVGETKQFLTTCAVDGLHRHALNESSDETGQIGRIRISRQITLGFCSLESPPKSILLLYSQRNQLLPDRLDLWTADQRRVNRHRYGSLATFPLKIPKRVLDCVGASVEILATGRRDSRSVWS
jgi:hypothetical protein